MEYNAVVKSMGSLVTILVCKMSVWAPKNDISFGRTDGDWIGSNPCFSFIAL